MPDFSVILAKMVINDLNDPKVLLNIVREMNNNELNAALLFMIDQMNNNHERFFSSGGDIILSVIVLVVSERLDPEFKSDDILKQMEEEDK